MNVRFLIAAAALSAAVAVPASAQVAFSGDGLYGNFYSQIRQDHADDGALTLGYAPTDERPAPAERGEATPLRALDDVRSARNGSASQRVAPLRAPVAAAD